ncbi:MAG: hypothetical protein ABI665_20375 [Vicinamibacterales bacterium]
MSAAAGISHPVLAQDAPSLAGRWSLNRELSQFPREVGFKADWIAAPGSGGDSSATGGGAGTNRQSFPVSRVSREDAARVKLLTDEVREPSARLTIVDTAFQVTIAAESGTARSFHPTGKEELLTADGTTLAVTARRESGRLVVLYKVEQGRELRYTYSRTAVPAQLVVEVEFLERGKGDVVRRVYEPVREIDTPATAVAPHSVPPPSANARAAPDYDRRPDAQFKGLTKLGVVVEGLSAQAVTCGLRQEALESAVVKQLSGAGFTITLNTDEDTYLYVNVMTATMANGLCISRYDAYLYSHTTARLEYHDTPVLVDVSLLHKGSIAAGNAAANADAVMRGVQDIVGQFTNRIRDANK